MAALSFLPAADSTIRRMVIEEKRTHSEVCRELMDSFPHLTRCLSTRSIRRYCADNNIHKTSRLKNNLLDHLVVTSIQKVLL